jgi:hypothetical protein
MLPSLHAHIGKEEHKLKRKDQAIGNKTEVRDEDLNNVEPNSTPLINIY